ncbi:MAG: PTS fructose transporter subunit IIA [Undibacterium sp.]|nr:PTS fructose transporter subunit IIA [Undibacterium sp.]
MLGLLLVTHAPLGTAFLQAVAHVYRQAPERLEAIDVLADQDIEAVNKLVAAAVQRLNDGAGVLVMTDILGATPSNCCSNVREQVQVAVITGLNLPMLLRAINYRHESLEAVVELALEGGHKGAQRA